MVSASLATIIEELVIKKLDESGASKLVMLGNTHGTNDLFGFIS